MSAWSWTEEEAEIQRKCWAHGYLLTPEQLRAEVRALGEVLSAVVGVRPSPSDHSAADVTPGRTGDS